jgi:hypothetical protein
MSSCTFVVSKRSGAAVRTVLSFILLGLAAQGCVLGNDNDPPLLAVDLIWDRSSTDKFWGGSCDQAGVVYMKWELQDDKGHTKKKGPKDGEPCLEGLDFASLLPGSYTFVVSGYDDKDKMLWEATCKHLDLGRFDVLHGCEIDKLADDTAQEPAEAPDAGSEDDAG